MEPGRLNRRVVIQQHAAGSDAQGQPTSGWVDVATVWADIQYLKGIEQIKADAVTSSARVSIRIRWRTDITAAMRVLYNSVVHTVQVVLPDVATRRYVDLVCEVLA